MILGGAVSALSERPPLRQGQESTSLDIIPPGRKAWFSELLLLPVLFSLLQEPLLILPSGTAIPPDTQPSLELGAQLPGLGKKGRLSLSPFSFSELFGLMGGLDSIPRASGDLASTATAAKGRTLPSGDTNPSFLPPAGSSPCSQCSLASNILQGHQSCCRLCPSTALEWNHYFLCVLNLPAHCLQQDSCL